MVLDRSLVAQVEAALAGHPLTRKYHVEVAVPPGPPFVG